MDPKVKERKFQATPITDFYSDKTVFITGGTGFVGAVLLGKLLTTCPIRRVYVLIKPKKGKSISQRITELIKSPTFDEVRNNNPIVLNNLIPISGNLRERKFGMSEEDFVLLCKEVQVVFHSAASINMDTSLKDVIECNTKSTEELVRLCREMQQLKVFVYISTAFSNCNRKLVDEKVYPPATNLKAIYEIYEEMDRPENKSHKYELMERRPNTYTYSKSLAEKIIEDGIQGIPAVIVRPSVVMSSLKYPVPGWTTSKSGVNRVVAGIADGSLHCWLNRLPDTICDVVPVDHVANLLLATAWDADRNRSNKVKVFHHCSGLQNPVSMGTLLGTCARISKRYSDKPITFTLNRSRSFHNVMWFFLHIIPAFFSDVFSWLSGQPTRMLKKTAAMDRLESVLCFFATNEFTFINYNTRKLFREMDEADQKIFDFDITTVDWESYFDTYVLGLKKYL